MIGGMAKKKRVERDRTVPVSPDQVKAYAKSAGRLASTLASLAEAIDMDGFTEPVGVAGAHLIDESFATLHRLVHKLAGNFYGTMTGATDRPTIPESVPESDPNTRNGASESRELPHPTETAKRKKTP